MDAATKAPNTIDGDQAVALAERTSSNFVIAIIQGGLSLAKRLLGGEFSNAWRGVRTGIYAALGTAAVTQHEAILEFILHYADTLSLYVSHAIRNPVLSEIIEFIARVFS